VPETVPTSPQPGPLRRIPNFLNLRVDIAFVVEKSLRPAR